MHTTSASLLMRLKQPGQAEAWSRFVRLYSPMVYTWAKKMGLQHADAVDLVQDVFAKLLRKLPEFGYDNHRRFRGWLWTITKNTWLKKRGRRSLPTDGKQTVDELIGAADESVEETDFREHLARQIIPTMQARFQPATWQAFWGQVVEGKTAPQVAAETGQSVDAVYKAKARVLSALHKELADLI